MIRLGIDASNLRAGGGITHLRELLAAADPLAHGLAQVTVWSGRATLDLLPGTRPWLVLQHEPVLDGPLPARLAWQARVLTRRVRASSDVLFAPGGLCFSHFHPFVTMSRSMLPFERRERQRYGGSGMRLKLALLRAGQRTTLRRADAVIFLTEYARREIVSYTGALPGVTAVIPHGINPAFSGVPRHRKDVVRGDAAHPFRLLYVSIVDAYKHQWHVAEAVARLRGQGWPIEIDFVGGSYPPALARLQQTLRRLDPEGGFLRYRGFVPYEALPREYERADAFVFASSCENMPNILLEGMASGLPVACSSRGPMPEVLGPSGVYFDPEEPASIAAAIQQLLEDGQLRADRAIAAQRRSREFSWKRTADETFDLIARVAGGRRTVRPIGGTQ